jgi:hypothetical protein
MSLGPNGVGDIRYVPDNTLLAEFVTMIYLWKRSISISSYDPFTCGVQSDPRLECLDIASSTNGATLFGGSCSGNTGDGYLGAYDVAKLLWVQFESPPYDSLSRTYSTIPTVYPRVGTAARCSYDGPLDLVGVGVPDFNGMIDWNVAVNSDSCVNGYGYVARLALPPPPPPGVRRRLTEDIVYIPSPREMSVKVDNWLKTDEGVWVRYSVAGVQIVMEMFIGGIRFDTLREVRLSNAPVPSYGFCNDTVNVCEPVNPFAMEVRFARRAEYTSERQVSCANVLPGFGSTIALQSNTLAIRQSPLRDACPVDIFLWIPNAEFPGVTDSDTSDWLVAEPRACLLRGSTVAQLSGDGQFLGADTCLSVGYLSAQPPPAPLSLSPSVSPSGSATWPPPSVPPTASSYYFPIWVFFVPAMAICVGTVGLGVVKRRSSGGLYDIPT